MQVLSIIIGSITDMRLKKTTAMLMSGLLLILASSCRVIEESTDSIDSMINNPSSYPDDIIPEDFIKDQIFDDGDHVYRVYDGFLIIHQNGKEYIAAGVYSSPGELGNYAASDSGIVTDEHTMSVYYTDDYVNSLSIGDEFRYDRDIRFTIDSLDVTDWGSVDADIPNGKIRLNDYFSLIHGSIERDDFDHITDSSKAKLWKLVYEPHLVRQNYKVMPPVSRIQLIELDPKCSYKFYDNGNIKDLTKEQYESFFAGDYAPKGVSYVNADLLIRRNKVYRVTMRDDI